MAKAVVIVAGSLDVGVAYSRALRARGYHAEWAIQAELGVFLARRHRPAMVLVEVDHSALNTPLPILQVLKDDPHTRSMRTCAILSAPLEAQRDLIGGELIDCQLPASIDPASLVSAVEQQIGPPDDADSDRM